MLCLWIIFACLICFNESAIFPVRPIRIALSVDDKTFRSIIVLINSVIEAAIDSDSLVFHIVACGENVVSSNVLKRLIVESMDACFPTIKKEVVAFSLPTLDNGFATQLAWALANPKKTSHWTSKFGADMARFYLASLFPTVDRLLYLDNDVIVSCCLEEIFDSDLGTDKVVGIALDDLAWATMTQFKYHYNASHPLVIKNMRRNQSAINQFIHNGAEPVSKEEFHKALPRYPNDGVLLIDVKRFNEHKILAALDEIAAANGRDEYVVHYGTQQFTVLTMFDRWAELTPRANLRHFPDMARGYLMWFYYNGFIHYAGQAKPKTLCEHGNYKDNPLRVQSYTSWALSNAQVADKCGFDKAVYAPHCVQHIPIIKTVFDLLLLMQQIARISKDETLEYIHAGPLHGDLSLSVAGGDVKAIEARNNTNTNANNIPYTLDFVEIFDRFALHNASWSFRNYDCTQHSQCETLLNRGVDTVFVNPKTVAAAQSDLARLAAKNKKKGISVDALDIPSNQLRFGGKRSFLVYKKNLCGGEVPSSNTTTPSSTTNKINSKNTPPTVAPCVTLIDDIRSAGKKHWDVIGLVIDMQPPSELFLSADNTANTQTTSSTSTNTQQTVSVVNSGASGSTSLTVLLGLDLVFMRPKFIFVRLTASGVSALESDVKIASKFLSRNGFVVQREREGYCHNTNSKSSDRVFGCIWGTRLNTFEIMRD